MVADARRGNEAVVDRSVIDQQSNTITRFASSKTRREKTASSSWNLAQHALILQRAEELEEFLLARERGGKAELHGWRLELVRLDSQRDRWVVDLSLDPEEVLLRERAHEDGLGGQLRDNLAELDDSLFEVVIGVLDLGGIEVDRM